MALPVTITGLSTAIACVGPYQSSAAPDVAFAANQSSSIGSQLHSYYAQTYLSNGGSCVKINVNMSRTGNPTGNITLQLRTTSGGNPTTTVLGTSDSVDVSTIGTSANNEVAFTFSTPVALTASTTYAIVSDNTGITDDASNRIDWQGNSTSGYANGSAFQSDNGSSWSATTPADLDFEVIVSATNYYFFGRNSIDSGKLDVLKATDPTSSFSLLSSTALSTTHGAYAGYKVSDLIHFIIGGGSVTYTYHAFNLDAERYSTSSENIAVGLSTAGQTGATQYGCSIVVRSAGEAVAFFNGAQTKKSGTNYARVYYSRRTGVNTWSAAAIVSAEDANDHFRPEAVLGTSDRVHFLWDATSNGLQRSLSSANSLQTVSGGTQPRMDQAVSYDDSGTIRVAAVGFNSTSGKDNSVHFDSANTPTQTVTNENEWDTASNIPVRVFNDGTDVWAMYLLDTDSDLYVQKSTDDLVTFDAAVSAFTGTVGASRENLSKDGNIYQRGSDVVIPYVVNDNGTLKYNEYVVRTVVDSSPYGWLRDGDPFRANDVIAKRDFHTLVYQ